MDRNLVTNYGLLLIVSLTMAVLLAMATPFGDYIGESYVAYIKMAKKGMDQEINHGYEDNMEYFDEMMNKDIFVVYIEAGLYETMDSYEEVGAYEPKFERLSLDWNTMTQDAILYTEDGTLKSKYDGKILDASEQDFLVGDIVLSNSTLTISKSCFENRDKITGIFMKSVERIEENAFKNCMGLKTIYISAPTIKEIGKAAFAGSGLRDIYFNGTRAEFSKIIWEEFSNVTVNIHCVDQTFAATI